MTQEATSKKQVEGVVEEIQSGSGAIERCPECRRPLTNDHCVVHLDVEGEKDLRIKAKLSDGSILVINNGVAEDLLGIDTEEAHVLPEHDVLRLINGTLKGKNIEATVSDIDEDENFLYVQSIERVGDL